MFVVTWGEFEPTLEDILNIMALPLYGEANTRSSTFAGEDKDKQQPLMVAVSSTKSSYALWISYFDEGVGSRLVLEAI